VTSCLGRPLEMSLCHEATVGHGLDRTALEKHQNQFHTMYGYIHTFMLAYLQLMYSFGSCISMQIKNLISIIIMM